MKLNLRNPLGNILTELSGAIKVVHKMWEQAENIQGKTYCIKQKIIYIKIFIVSYMDIKLH